MAETMRYVAIGDSYTEGVGDELASGRARGWADLTALGLARSGKYDVEYANLAIRGRLIRPIIEEQLEQALELRPTMLSFNGGGNVMLRPRASMDALADLYVHVHERCRAHGTHLLMVSGANPSGLMPGGRTLQRRGDELLLGVQDRLKDADDATVVLPWQDPVLRTDRFWADDRLHLNTRGHHRVAATVLDALGAPAPADWWDLSYEDVRRSTGWGYYREYVFPWISRRLTGRSSGDGRTAKFPAWTAVDEGFGQAE